MKKKFIHIIYSIISKLRRNKHIWKFLNYMYEIVIPDKLILYPVGKYEIFVNPKDKGLGQKLFLTGNYAKGRSRILKENISLGHTVLDIGANIGYFTMQMAELVGESGKVIAFEPDPRNYEILEKSICTQNLENVIPIKCAVSNINKRGKFYLNPSVTANTIKKENGHMEIDMDIIKLDTKLSELGISKVDFVKMDTDGSEPLAIHGMQNIINNSRDIKILMEYSPGNVKRYFEPPSKSLDYIFNCKLKIEQIFDTEDVTLKAHNRCDLDKLGDNENLDILFVRNW